MTILHSPSGRWQHNVVLLAIFLRTGLRGATAVDLARQQLAAGGGLRAMLDSSPEVMARLPGMGMARRALLLAALELGPKGTGKSHVYAEFSPHGMLISGSEVTAPKLFVSNANGKVGLVGYWDCICFDEFAGKDKKVDKTLVDIMKNFMANRTFSRGIEQLSAEASMVFMGNTKKSVAYMLKHSHFYEALPDKYIDSAFLDRVHAFNPGWEVQPVRHELFCTGYGFVVDYIAEVLKHLRTEDFTSHYKQYFEISSEVSTRDQTGFEKTFSGLMKILHPDGKATPEEVSEILEFSMECRRRVREQILRIDDTFKPNDFDYKPLGGGAAVRVLTPEEKQYPQFAKLRPGLEDSTTIESPDEALEVEDQGGMDHSDSTESSQSGPELNEHHLVVPENSKGWSYRRIFQSYLRGCSGIIIRDPYIRAFHQIRNLVEFLRMVNEFTPQGDEVSIHLITGADSDAPDKFEKQMECRQKLLKQKQIKKVPQKKNKFFFNVHNSLR